MCPDSHVIVSGNSKRVWLRKKSKLKQIVKMQSRYSKIFHP